LYFDIDKLNNNLVLNVYRKVFYKGETMNIFYLEEAEE